METQPPSEARLPTLRLVGEGPLPIPGDLDEAREHLREESEDARRRVGPSAKRLLLAGIGILFGGVLFFAVLPHLGVYLPPIVPAAAFLVILFGAIASGRTEKRIYEEENGLEPVIEQPEVDDNARPVLCCPGPRPLGAKRLPPPR